KQCLQVLCALLVALLGSAGSQASQSNVILLESHLHKQTVGAGIEYLEDPTGSLTARELLTGNHAWQRNSAEIFNQGYNGSVWWLRFQLRNASSQPDWLMEIAYPVLDYLDIYLVRDNSILKHLPLGDKLPYPDRPDEHRHYLATLPLPAVAQTD